MIRKKATIIFSILMAVGSSVILLSSCRDKIRDGTIVITMIPLKLQDIDYATGDSGRYILQSQIAAIDPDKIGGSLKVLTEGYFSARSPEISYDAKTLLFAAKQYQDSPWQIWEMNLKNSRIRRITYSKENCIDPAYLPDGRLVFSKLTTNDSLKAEYSLYTCKPDGSYTKRITFNPHTYFASNVINDGRILTISRQLYPEKENPVFMILRPDGTKAELFYKGNEDRILSGRGWETTNDKIVFIESDNGNQGRGNLISISYNRPLHSRTNYNFAINGDFHYVYPELSGELLVSYRKSESERYALYEFDTEYKVLGPTIYANPDYDITEAVVVEEHLRPRKLPSEVDLQVKTGLLLCQNINILDPQTQTSASLQKKAFKIEVLGLNSSLGTVNVEEDGSFYLKAMADAPFRIQTLDENGKIINGPCDWIWLRPNERRGCAGCHEDHELVPENRVPLSVKKPPVQIPVHVEIVKEKTVELE
jgi:hypothetical protein